MMLVTALMEILRHTYLPKFFVFYLIRVILLYHIYILLIFTLYLCLDLLSSNNKKYCLLFAVNENRSVRFWLLLAVHTFMVVLHNGGIFEFKIFCIKSMTSVRTENGPICILNPNYAAENIEKYKTSATQ